MVAPAHNMLMRTEPIQAAVELVIGLAAVVIIGALLFVDGWHPPKPPSSKR